MRQLIADVAEELEKLGITSEYRVSLAWDSTADLDIYVKNVETGEWIYYSNKESSDGNTKHNADNEGGAMPEGRKKHVENIRGANSIQSREMSQKSSQNTSCMGKIMSFSWLH